MRILKNHKLLERGFTLIEMAMAVIIIGVAIAAFAPLYKQYLDKQAESATASNVEIVSQAIGSFRSLNGRYPCPAPLNVGRGDPNYGREMCAANSTATAPGNAVPDALGQFVELSPRVVNNYLDPFTLGNPPLPPGSQPRVRVGAVPFRQLNIKESEAIDGYHNRLLYVVTEHLAFDATFRGDQGGIAILDGAGGSVINPPSSAHFLVLSSGENKLGAWSSAGVQIPCPAAAGALENQNCNRTADAIYRLAETNTSGGDNHFDDVMTYFTQINVPLWQLSSAAGAVPFSIHQKPDDQVGFYREPGDSLSSFGNDSAFAGTTARAQDAPVPGNQGQVQAIELCDPSKNDCFKTDLIAGAGMHCPGDDTVVDTYPDGTVITPGIYMIGISRGRPICADEIKAECPNPVRGIKKNSDGVTYGLDCGDPLPNDCGPAKVTLCVTDDSDLPAAPHGTVKTLHAGDSREQAFQCSNGTWSALGSPTGHCDCKPGTTSSSGSCGTGFVGSETTTCVTTCAPLTVTCTGDRSTCSCAGYVETKFEACPVTWHTGHIKYEKAFTCDPTDPNKLIEGSWVETENTCNCVEPLPETVTENCVAPYFGTKTITYQYSCADNMKHKTGETDNCACNDIIGDYPENCSDTETEKTVGLKWFEWTFKCSTNSWTKGKLKSQDCKKPPPIDCKWQSLSGIQSIKNSPSGPRLYNNCTQGNRCNPATPANCHHKVGSVYQIWGNCVCRPQN